MWSAIQNIKLDLNPANVAEVYKEKVGWDIRTPHVVTLKVVWLGDISDFFLKWGFRGWFIGQIDDNVELKIVVIMCF